MDKSKLKKLAVLGMAGGMLLSTQAGVEAANIDTTTDTFLAHNGCGANSCSGKPKSPQNRENSCNQRASCNGYTADSDRVVQHVHGNKLNESELLNKLDGEGKKTYNSLDAEGKALALKLANQECSGKNDCKGLNSCDTPENVCAGKAGCKGKSPGPFRDKNDAVKVAGQKMAEKRAKSGSN